MLVNMPNLFYYLNLQISANKIVLIMVVSFSKLRCCDNCGNVFVKKVGGGCPSCQGGFSTLIEDPSD